MCSQRAAPQRRGSAQAFSRQRRTVNDGAEARARPFGPRMRDLAAMHDTRGTCGDLELRQPLGVLRAFTLMGRCPTVARDGAAVTGATCTYPRCSRAGCRLKACSSCRVPRAYALLYAKQRGRALAALQLLLRHQLSSRLLSDGGPKANQCFSARCIPLCSLFRVRRRAAAAMSSINGLAVGLPADKGHPTKKLERKARPGATKGVRPPPLPEKLRSSDCSLHGG